MEKNTHLFYCQDLLWAMASECPCEDNVYQISHCLHWPLVGFALLKNNDSAYQYIGCSQWLWSWKSMNVINSRNTWK